ncbi:MAG: hypothetical protein ACR2QF_10415 [Geminicoccaceae bacterium]
MLKSLLLALPLSLAGGAATTAGEADVVGVEATAEGGGSYRFDVTVEHADEGWDHYADAWDVVGPDGAVLGTRVLAHPHENEQPFTRSLTGVAIPDGVTEVTLRAKDSVHDYGGVEMAVTLPGE